MKNNKEGRKLRCKCRYEWTTLSKMKWVTCPNCLGKVRNEGVKGGENGSGIKKG